MSASSEQTETAANPPAAANRHAGPVLPNTLPNALDFLTAMEQQLAEFRQLAAQQQLAETVLAEMRGELEQRAASLDAKARQTDESTLVLAALDEELNTRRQDLDRQAGDLQAKQASDAEALAKLEQEFKARYARLEAENSAAKADLAAAQEAVQSGEQNRCAAEQRAAESESSECRSKPKRCGWSPSVPSCRPRMPRR